MYLIVCAFSKEVVTSWRQLGVVIFTFKNITET